jgi:phosphatidylglycerophosphate synthase
MRARVLFTVLMTALISLTVFAAPALAKIKSEGGEGAYGKTDDVVVTNFGFGLIIFFALLVTVMSIGQYLLERRKQLK